MNQSLSQMLLDYRKKTSREGIEVTSGAAGNNVINAYDSDEEMECHWDSCIIHTICMQSIFLVYIITISKDGAEVAINNALICGQVILFISSLI